MGLNYSTPVEENKLSNSSDLNQNNSDLNQNSESESESNTDSDTTYVPKYFISEETKELHQIEVAKNNLNYNGVVFEGGGSKGVAYCGAIRVMEEFKIIEKLWRYAGSSIGSILATLLALGYSSEEIETIINNVDFDSFIDDKKGALYDSYQLINNLGICRGKTIIEFMEKIINDKTGNPNYTFGDLWNDKQKELVITSTNLTHNKSVFFSYKNYPNVPIKTAVRASTSIPYLYVPVELDGMMLADGGIKDNYPIHVFDGKTPSDEMAEHNLTSMNPHIIGFRLITSNELKETLEGSKINNLKDLTMTLINNMYSIQEDQFIRPGFAKRTVSILTPDISLTDFDVTDSLKEEMITSGKECTYQFFRSTIIS